jgi:hypothetical protein
MASGGLYGSSWWRMVPGESSWQCMVSDGNVAWVTIQGFGKVCRIVTLGQFKSIIPPKGYYCTGRQRFGEQIESELVNGVMQYNLRQAMKGILMISD